MIKLVKMECPSCGGVLKKKKFGNYNCPYCGMDYKLDMDIIVPVPKGEKPGTFAADAQNKAVIRRSIAVILLAIAAAVVAVCIIAGGKSETTVKKPATPGVKVAETKKGISSPYFQQLFSKAFGKDYSEISEEELAHLTYLDLLTDKKNVGYKIDDGELKNAEIDLEGSIKYDDLKLLKGLKTLKFDAYKEYSTVVSNMTELEEISCRFSPDRLVKALPSPEKLKVLDCYYSDEPLGEISKLANLEKLSIKFYSTSLSKEKTPDLSEIGKLTKLADISLDMDDYMVFPFMSSLTKLKSVNIHCDTLKDISFLENMPGLESLTLVDCDILNIDSLKALTKLKTLRLEDCYKVESYELVPAFTELEELMLSYYHGQKLPESFGSLKKVKRLTLQGFNDIEFLEDFPKLEYLRLYGCNYSNFGKAACMKDLKELKIGGGTSLYGLEFLTKLEKLEKVDFSGLEAGTDTEKLFNIPNLKELNLNNTSFAMDLNVIKRNESLETLYLENLSWKAYNDESYTAERVYKYENWDKLPLTECFSFLSNFPNLKILSIEGNKLENIDFLKDLKKLESLNLTNNYIRDLTVVNSLPALKELFCGENSLTAQNADDRIKTDYNSTAKKKDPFNHYSW